MRRDEVIWDQEVAKQTDDSERIKGRWRWKDEGEEKRGKWNNKRKTLRRRERRKKQKWQRLKHFRKPQWRKAVNHCLYNVKPRYLLSWEYSLVPLSCLYTATWIWISMLSIKTTSLTLTKSYKHYTHIIPWTTLHVVRLLFPLLWQSKQTIFVLTSFRAKPWQGYTTRPTTSHPRLSHIFCYVAIASYHDVQGTLCCHWLIC